jgi:hypothetical protein
MTLLVDLVNLSNVLHLCLSQISYIASGLALLEDEQKFKLGGVLVVIKCQFHASTCRVYARNDYVNTLSTHRVPQF